MDISWPTALCLQTRVVYLWVYVFTQHQYGTPQIVLHVFYLFYTFTWWVVITVTIIRWRDWEAKRLSNIMFNVIVHAWQSWNLNPGILAARAVRSLPTPEVLNNESLNQQISLTWEPVRHANYWAHPRPTESENSRVGSAMPVLTTCRWFCCMVKSKNPGLHHRSYSSGCAEPEEGAPRQTFIPE